VQEARTVLDELIAAHPRSAAVLEARRLGHLASLEHALELASVENPAADEPAALRELEALAREPYDFAVFAAGVVRASLLWKRGAAADAQVLMTETLKGWLQKPSSSMILPQQESFEAFHIGSMHIHASRSSNVSSHSFSLGGKLVRNDAFALLDGEGAECTLNGLYLADGERLVDNHTSIDHAKAHCPSHEIYKGILGGKARAVFNGKIIVRPDAQKTDAKQTNRALLLSDEAQINTKPQLEIFADDVKCTHGAAIGQLDEDAIFYLRARGLTYFEARDMLILAFAGDILDRVKVEPLRVALEEELYAQLAKDLAELDAA
jgi:FeS assembly protein SufD